MDIKIDGFTSERKLYYQKALDIRSAVFVQELGYDRFLEFDGKDDTSMHYILFVDKQAVGCARWMEDKAEITIDRFCIVKSFRKWGLGIVMLKFMLSELRPSKKQINILASDDTFIFFTVAGFKDSGNKVTFGKKTLRILKFADV
ncbi:MAG: GNAT family N-acetyltransferase [Chloroflexia bacterium]|nr:GNAT family N-acetyltransferase [Chloroflexia bacterium]